MHPLVVNTIVWMWRRWWSSVISGSKNRKEISSNKTSKITSSHHIDSRKCDVFGIFAPRPRSVHWICSLWLQIWCDRIWFIHSKLKFFPKTFANHWAELFIRAKVWIYGIFTFLLGLTSFTCGLYSSCEENQYTRMPEAWKIGAKYAVSATFFFFYIAYFFPVLLFYYWWNGRY